MPALLMSLLADRRLWGALGLAAVLALAGAQTARLAHAKAALAASRADLATCRDGAVALRRALDGQSASLAALKARGAADSAAATRSARAARIATRSAEALAARLLAAPPGADACASADALILHSLGGGKP